MKQKTNAFTLIELLVVVSIIALLVAIMIPALAKARQLAQRSICMNNQRQCLTIFHMYAGDFNDYLPKGNKGPQDDSPEIWTEVNFQTCITLYEMYDINENIGICSAWENERENFYYEPPDFNNPQIPDKGTVAGYIYYGRRFDKPNSPWSPRLPDGSTYQSPKRLSDPKNQITSSILLSCYHWDSITPGGPWGAKIPHAKNGRGLCLPATQKELSPQPQGLSTCFMDGSTTWTNWNSLDYFTQNNQIQIYFAKQ